MDDNVTSLAAGPSLAIPEFYNIAADVCDRPAAEAPERLALVVASDDRIERLSRAELRDRANAAANILSDLGIGRGDRVAIVLPIDSWVPVIHFACWKLGAISCPMSALFGSDALGYRFDDAEVSAVVTASALLPTVREASASCPSLRHILLTDGTAPGTLDLSALAADAPVHFEAVATRAEDPAFINYTSGTTGPPKGALAAHRTMLGHLASLEFVNGDARAGDVQYSPADWAWLAGLAGMLGALHSGRTVAARRRIGFDAEETLRFLSEFRITHATLMPTMLRRMMSLPPETLAAAPLSLRNVLTGSEAVGADLYHWVEEVLDVELCEAFGQTECNACLLSNSKRMVPRPGSLGLPAPGFDVAIVDDEGRPQPAGTTGQIGVREGHPIMMLGYWRSAEATERKYAGGWLLTGDLAHMDAEGYFWFVGRSDDIINSSGYRIGPGEIEQCLVKHGAVAAAAGVPDPDRHEIIKAFIVLAPRRGGGRRVERGYPVVRSQPPRTT